MAGLPNLDSRTEIPATKEVYEALGQSESFLDFQEHLSHAAAVNRPILLIGERGTGKEMAATRIHYLSPRWQGPFVALNCSALAPSLIESELFGHEAGSFTGAAGRRTGRFESANGGTLFLDEIGNIPLEVQEKILRAVEYGTFERVGSSKPIEVDVRIVGATNADLQKLADDGEFMTDLLDRLSFDVLVLPPLRERLDDIPLLANHFAARMAYELGRQEVPEITPEAMERLETFAWPGNVRELKNVVERAVYKSRDHIVTEQEIIFDPFRKFSHGAAAPSRSISESTGEMRDSHEPGSSTEPTVNLDVPLSDQVRELELRLLRCGLENAKFNQKKAAELLGLTYHQFRGLYRKYQDELTE